MKAGDRIKELRDKLGMSQAELAAKVGISQTGLSSIEKNLTQQSGSLIPIAKVLGTTPHELLTGLPAPVDTLKLNPEYLEVFLRLAPQELKKKGLEPTPQLMAKVIASAYNFAINALGGEDLSSQSAHLSLFRAFEDQLKS